MEVSAKDGTNINEVFDRLARRIVLTMEKREIIKSQKRLSLAKLPSSASEIEERQVKKCQR